MMVRVSELRRAANILFDYLERTERAEIEMDQDHYWNIRQEDLYDVYEQPTEFTIGQLAEDLERLRAIGEGRSDPIAYGLVWLSSILRFVGGKVVG